MTKEITIIEKEYFKDLQEIKEIIKNSENRVTSICPYYNECGGCNFLHTTYDEEIKFKKEKAKERKSADGCI